jgi:hypothetical protein
VRERDSVRGFHDVIGRREDEGVDPVLHEPAVKYRIRFSMGGVARQYRDYRLSVVFGYEHFLARARSELGLGAYHHRVAPADEVAIHAADEERMLSSTGTFGSAISIEGSSARSAAEYSTRQSRKVAASQSHFGMLPAR